jgi:polyisoprenoid-binding protein YceI
VAWFRLCLIDADAIGFIPCAAHFCRNRRRVGNNRHSGDVSPERTHKEGTAVMRLSARIVVMMSLALSAGSCTAVRVVTHTTSDDPVDLPAGVYHVDPPHCSITFDVDHLGYSRFTMRFDRASAQLEFTPQTPETSRVTAVIDASSLDTNVAALDRSVKGADLLDVEHFPDIRFTSTALQRTGKNSGVMTGAMTIHGETHPVSLAVTLNGGARNPLTGDDTLGFTATGTIDRADYGLTTWYPAVGTTIHVVIQVEFVKPQPFD